MKWLNFLSPDFVKISRSEFINLNYLDHLELSVQGTIALKLKTVLRPLWLDVVSKSQRKARDLK